MAKTTKHNEDAEVSVEARLVASPIRWDDDSPGINWWSASMSLSFGDKAAVLASADLCQVDNNLCRELSYELDYISPDCGRVGGAIEGSTSRGLLDLAIAGGMNSTFLIADTVVVDKFWRGRRLGPALVFFVADVLRADAVFLIPAALRTQVDADGRCLAVYGPPRPGPAAQAKVEEAWKRAGFRALRDSVVWTPTNPRQAQRARRRLMDLADEVSDARSRAWWRRRLGRIAST